MNLAVSFVGSRNEGNEVQQGQNLIEGCNPIPSVQFRETRSSYFLDIDLPGLRREDIWLQMDNTRKLIIRGQKLLQDMGMVTWTWHLVQRGGSRQRPFRIPRDVNVNAVTAHFRHGVLNVAMPKLRWSRFTPYEINGRSSEGSHLQLFPRIETILQGTYAHQAGPTKLQSRNIPCQGKKFSGEIAEMADAEDPVRSIEMEGHGEEGDQTSMTITMEEQRVDFPAEELCPSSEPPQSITTEEAKVEETEKPCDHVISSSQNLQEERPLTEEEVLQTVSAAPSHTVSNAGAEEGTALLEDVHEKQKVEETIPHCEEAKADESLGSEKVVDPSKPQQDGSNKGFSNLFSSIAAIATLKWRRG